ncbi:YHS domain-containing protein [Paracoccus sp. S-4012]|nr:YHS domain-containing protein [Paracoccus sp. S-4012]
MLAPLLALMLLLLPGAAAANWALDGMDVVAYRTQGQAVPGRSDIRTEWAGQDWHFASEENRAAFEANPRDYAPGLRGLCPKMLAVDHQAVRGDPRYFVIVGQRLYLLSSPAARDAFMADPRRMLMAAKETFVELGL